MSETHLSILKFQYSGQRWLLHFELSSTDIIAKSFQQYKHICYEECLQSFILHSFHKITAWHIKRNRLPQELCLLLVNSQTFCLTSRLAEHVWTVAPSSVIFRHDKRCRGQQENSSMQMPMSNVKGKCHKHLGTTGHFTFNMHHLLIIRLQKQRTYCVYITNYEGPPYY